MDREELLSQFDEETDVGYLEKHCDRFLLTRNTAYRDWRWPQAHVLDIGAHWLHQSTLYALDGHRVTAADFPEVLDRYSVRATAQRHGIALLSYTDLSSARVFDDLDESSVDVVLFTEILEHITFNPVDMWKAIYRVLKPGGRIILTTPNLYRGWSGFSLLFRFLSGRGQGLPVEEVIGYPTYGPHWKEYSRRELRRYFELLSPDFSVWRLEYMSNSRATHDLNWKGRLVHDPRNIVPFLRPILYAEIDLDAKQSGVAVEPGW